MTTMTPATNDTTVKLTKSSVVKAMAKAGIKGEVTGRGAAFQVELPDEAALDAFQATITSELPGYRTGYGSWVLRPGYVSSGDWNDRSARCHY